MTDTHELATWMGKPVDELTREEAIAALKLMFREQQQMRQTYEGSLAMLTQAREARERRWF